MIVRLLEKIHSHLLKIGFFIILAMVTSCDSDKYYDESMSLQHDKWPEDKAMTFRVSILDTIGTYSFFINIRNNTSYNYNNIFFFLTTEFPGGGMSRDTIECLLAAKNGEWLGRGSGRYRDNRILIRKKVRFPRSGTYVLSLNQAMREDTLEGISEAGIRLEKEEKN